MRSLAIAAVLALAAAPVAAQFQHPPRRTVAQLGTCAASGVGGPRLVIATDGATASDCATGGGSTAVLCMCSGVAWEAIGSGAGGATALDDLTDVSTSGAAAGEGLVYVGPGWAPSTAAVMLTGDAPTAHAASHEDGGGDELDLAGLTGLTATPQTPAAHVHAAGDVTSGTLAHERGGLEADVSAFGGLVRVSGGATSSVTNLAGLNTALGSSVSDGAHTTDTGPSPDCSGTSTYQDGEGGCDAVGGDLSGGLDALALGADTVGAAELADADLGQVAISGGVVTVEGLQYGAAFPGSPATGDVFAVTDDSAAGACDSAAGAALSLCRWSGAAWVALGDGGGGGGTPGGADTQPQYNDGGAFGGITGMAWNDVTEELTISGRTDAASERVAIFSGPDRATPAVADRAYFSLFSDTSGGLAEIARLAWDTNAGTGAGGSSKFEVAINLMGTITPGLLVSGYGLSSPAVYLPAGTSSTPGWNFGLEPGGNGANEGCYFVSNGIVACVGQGGEAFRWQSGILRLPTAGLLNWSTDFGIARTAAAAGKVTDGSSGYGTLTQLLATLVPQASPPTCPTSEAGLYFDSSGALCICPPGGSWSMVWPAVPTTENCT